MRLHKNARHSMLYIMSIACLLIMFPAIPVSSATVRIHGVVSDSYGTTIRGAMVTFVSSQDSVTAFTDNDGFYEAYLSDTPTGVHDSQHPSAIQLAQNYPNPFNPSTTIQYSLERHAAVRLDVYSITGQHVRTLVNGSVSPGTHSVVWDGHDDDGRGVSAGVYVYRLCAGSEVAVRKMLLLDGSVSGGVAVSRITSVSVGKSARTADNREYTITASKSTLWPYQGNITVTFDDPDIEQDIIIIGHYRTYVMYCDSPRVFNGFIVPGDTLGITLIGIHEDMPTEGTVTLMTQTGDQETLTVSGSEPYYRQLSDCINYLFASSRSGKLISSASQPVVGDGILQVDAVSDTVSAWLETSWGDTIRIHIPVADLAVTVELWGRTYYQLDDKWYQLLDRDEVPYKWLRQQTNDFTVVFAESVDLDTIDAFVTDNGLQYGHKVTDHWMVLKIDDAVPLLLEQKDNPIIEDAYLLSIVCSAKQSK